MCSVQDSNITEPKKSLMTIVMENRTAKKAEKLT